MTNEQKLKAYEIIDAMPSNERMYWTCNGEQSYDFVIQSHVDSIKAYKKGASWLRTCGDRNYDLIQFLLTETELKDTPRIVFNPA